jgi:hypothetical protein
MICFSKVRLLLDCITNLEIWNRDGGGWNAAYWSVPGTIFLNFFHTA